MPVSIIVLGAREGGREVGEEWVTTGWRGGRKRGIMDIAVRGSVCRGEGKDKMESAVCVIKVTEQSKA
jgi:hypothetical protein